MRRLIPSKSGTDGAEAWLETRLTAYMRSGRVYFHNIQNFSDMSPENS